MIGLTSEQYSLFLTVHTRHLKSMGSEDQKKYRIENVKRIKWDRKENCLKVYYSDTWWHYNKRGCWY